MCVSVMHLVLIGFMYGMLVILPGLYVPKLTEVQMSPDLEAFEKRDKAASL